MRFRYSRRVELIGVICLAALLIPRPAYAYFDPGTGSFVMQLLIAAALGLGLAVRRFGNRLMAIFRTRNKRVEPEGPQDKQ